MPENNEGISNPVTACRETSEPFFVSVFDGMGGESYGEAAAYTAASTRANLPVCSDNDNCEEFLIKSSLALNDAVVASAREHKTECMGTTSVELYFKDEVCWVSNVGDSRAYLYRDGLLRQLSVDHCDESYARILPNGKKTKAPLTQHLGIDPEVFVIEPAICRVPVTAGDRFLICSDGITDMLSDAEIAAVLSQNPDVQNCTAALLDAALENGGRDNITVIVCRVDEKQPDAEQSNAEQPDEEQTDMDQPNTEQPNEEQPVAEQKPVTRAKSKLPIILTAAAVIIALLGLAGVLISHIT